MKIVAVLYNNPEDEVFTTPLSSTLRVVGDNLKKGSSKRVVVFCKMCSETGNGYFFTQRSKLVKGVTPCRCSPKYRRTRDEWKDFFRVFAKNCGYSLYGMEGKKLTLLCPHHGTFSITYNGQRRICPSCRKLSRDSLQPNPHPIFEDFISGYTGDIVSGGNLTIGYVCPRCSNDEFRKSGLCSGVFRISSGDWGKGRISCRCSRSYRYTDEMNRHRVEREIRRRASSLSVTSVSGDTVELSCGEHGDFHQDLHKFLSGTGCPSCSGKISNFGYLNLVKDGNIDVAIKFGISVNPSRRLRQQNIRNRMKMENLYVFIFPNPALCKAAEEECKSFLSCGVLSPHDLSDGHTETTLVSNIPCVVDIFKKFGGIPWE